MKDFTSVTVVVLLVPQVWTWKAVVYQPKAL